jgi:hypothetical protein
LLVWVSAFLNGVEEEDFVYFFDALDFGVYNIDCARVL